MGRIFLSHSTKEYELVVHIANYLEKNNLQAWYAPRDIVGGIDYDLEIIAAIKDCRAFVLLLSRNSDASEDVKTEVYHAVKFKKQVICLDVDDVEPENLSYLLGMRHRLNWLERRDETLDKLIHDIRVIHEPDSQPHTPEPVIKTPAPKPEPVIQPPAPKPKPEPEPKPKPTGNIKGFWDNYRWAVIAVAFLLVIGMIPVLGDSKPSLLEPVKVEPVKVEPVKVEPVKPVETKKPVNYDVVSLAKDGKLEELRKAINAGADVNAKDNKGATALIQAAMLGHTATAELLLKHGADINAKDNRGSTALIWAAINGKTETAELLLKNGADINAKNKYGCTALMYAAFDGHPEIAEILITYEANKNLRDKNGSTAYDYVRYVRKGSVRREKGFSASLLERLKPDK